MTFDSTHARGYEVGSTSMNMLNAVRENDSDAWRKLAESYAPLIYGWCRKRNLQSHSAADVVQEVLTAIAKNLDRFSKKDHDASFRGWLWTITQNKIRDQYRKAGNIPFAIGGSDAQNMFGRLPANALIDSESSSRTDQEDFDSVFEVLETVRREFSEKTWNAFWLTTAEECTSTVAAKELGMTANAVRLAKSRVLRRLRLVNQLNDGQAEST